MKQSDSIFARWQGKKYERLEDSTLQFDQQFDAALFRETLFIFRKNDFQHILRYYDLLKAVAERSFDAVTAAIPVSNLADFKVSCLSHLHKLEKLRNISLKPYLASVTMSDIEETISEFKLKVRVVQTNGQKALLFDKSDPWAILNLLDDAYLGSKMTGRKYEVNSKREL